MRLHRKNWVWALALSGALGVAGAVVPVMAQEKAQTKATDTPQTPERPVIAGSLAGAFLAARTAEADNDLGDAITFYQRAVVFDPDNTALQQSLMLALISAGRFDEALPQAEKLKSVPDIERYSRLALGVDAIRSKQFRSAENLLKLVAGSDLDNLLTGILSGWAKFGAATPADGIADLEKLKGPAWYDLFRNYHSALMADAGGLADAGKRYQAVLDDRAAAGAAPDTWLRAVEAYASWLARNGRRQEALAVLDQGDEVASGRASADALRAKINDSEPVRAQAQTPQQGGAEMLLNLATALNRSGGETFVRLYLQYGRALEPANDTILVTLGTIAEKLGQSAEAITYYKQIPQTSAYRRMSELQLGLNMADLDRYDEAVTHLKAAIAEDPRDMRAYLALSGVYSSKEKFAESAALLDEAVALHPVAVAEDWNLCYRRGISHERIKQWDKAEASFKRALELYPDQPQVLNYLGYSWVDMNINLDEGLAMIRKAVDLRPEDGYIVDSLGWAYYRLGRFEEAVTELERAVSLRPEDPTINDHLGDAYWRAGRKLEATFQWSHSRDLKAEDELLAIIAKKLKEGLPELEPKETVSEPVAPADPGTKG